MMNTNLVVITLDKLSILLLLTVPVVWMLHRWGISAKRPSHGLLRMLLQLLLVGYLLTFLFTQQTVWLTFVVVSVMVLVASWITISNIERARAGLYGPVLISLLLGAGSMLLVVTQFVLQIEPWYSANYWVPLAGMVFANSMNTVSLALERFSAEQQRLQEFVQARAVAIRAAMIPVINSLFAVGVVSLPGMMTGQILAGVSPLLAARYQIVIMCMIFISSACSLMLFFFFGRRELLSMYRETISDETDTES